MESMKSYAQRCASRASQPVHSAVRPSPCTALCIQAHAQRRGASRPMHSAVHPSNCTSLCIQAQAQRRAPLKSHAISRNAAKSNEI